MDAIKQTDRNQKQIVYSFAHHNIIDTSKQSMHFPNTVFETVVFSIGLGIVILVVARKWNIPSIPLLLIGGFCFGKEGLGIIDLDSFGPLFKAIISFSVAIILFEGGLTLDYSGYKRMNKPIRRLLTVGVLITWLSTSLFVYVVFSYSFLFSLLAGSLVIVTGPTVILPILRRINPQKNVYHILHWEGVLIDPIGVFIAVLCFDLIGTDLAVVAFLQFFLQFLSGIGFGIVFGFGSVLLLRKRIIPQDLTNVFVLGVAVVGYGLCDWLVPESGLLAVILAGSIIGFQKPIPMEGIKRFKLELTQILVALIFILLSSGLEMSNIALFGLKGFSLVLFVIVVARPLSVLLSTVGTGLRLKEKLFLSWVAPRGVVAASIATIFGVRLYSQGVSEAWFIETFTFSVIASTVLIQGLTAGFAAKILGVQKQQLNGCLIVGIHAFSEKIADFLIEHGKRDVLFIDRNKQKVDGCRMRGYHALLADSMDMSLLDDEQFSDVGLLLALTDNEELNTLICQQWNASIGDKNVYKWGTSTHQSQSEQGQINHHCLWYGLSKPSVVSRHLLTGNMRLFTVKGYKKTPKKREFLMAISQQEIIIEPKKRELLFSKSTDKPLVSLYIYNPSNQNSL